MNRSTLTLSFFGAAAISMLLPASAFAQTETLRVRYYSEPGYAGEGMPYRDCSMEFDEYQEDISETPFTLEQTTLNSGLTPEQAEELRQEMRVAQQGIVDQYDQLLQSMPANNPNRAEYLFRRAEAIRELADADYLVARADFNEQINNWYDCVSDEPAYEPMPDYAEAIEEYAAVARNHPSYVRIDEVIFRLGETLMENDDAAQSIQYLSRLVNTYPDSQYLPDAHLMMGEHYFNSDLLIAARQNYEEVLNFPQSSIYNYAIYKIAWVDLNEELFTEALNHFQTVVSNLDANPEDTLDFRNQALNDMLRAYSELDGGWQMARDYYEALEGDEFMRRKLGQLANLFVEQGKDDSRVEILTYFLERYPYDAMVPQWAADTLDSLNNIGLWDNYESAAREFIVMLEPGSRWAVENQGNDRELTNARSFSEQWLLAIITRNDAEARRFTDPELKRPLFAEVADDYEEYFSRFGDSDEAYDQRFFYAETLYYQMANSGDCEDEEHFFDSAACTGYLQDAGDQYYQVVEMRPDPEAEHAHDAALGALQVYDGFMADANPRVDEDLPPPSEFESILPTDANGETTRVDLNEEAQQYVDIVSWFAELYPEDDVIPAASWRAASLYLYAGQINEAAVRFETIIQHHPNHRFAMNAAISAFVCYSAVENWVGIESTARQLLDNCVGDDETCNRESLTGALAFAMNNQAVDLMEEAQQREIAGEEDEAQALRLEAAEKQVALYNEFPDSEWSPAALNNAAATYESAREIRTSIDLYNEFLTAYPEHEFEADVKFTLGLIHQSVAEFAEAADWYEQVDEYEDFEDRSTAVLEAARLRQAMSEFDRAIELYDHYVELEPEEDVSKEIYFQIANMERDRGNLDAAFDRLQAFRDRFTDDAVRRLVATYQQADIRREQGNMEAARSLYEDVYNQFGPGEMAFNEENTPEGWTTAPGANFANDEERLGVLPFAAESRFWIAEADFETARASNLEYRVGRTDELIEKLSARGDALSAAERSMYEVLNMGDAEWGVAAAARLGQLYKDFDYDLYQVPPPDYNDCLDATNYNYDMCDASEAQFYEQLDFYGEILQTKALERWAVGFDLALENGIYTPFVAEMTTSLNQMDPSYAVGGAEGVEATSSLDAYVSTGYILDLDDKIEAFEGFVDPATIPTGPVDGPGVELDAPDAAPTPGAEAPAEDAPEAGEPAEGGE